MKSQIMRIAENGVGMGSGGMKVKKKIHWNQKTKFLALGRILSLGTYHGQLCYSWVDLGSLVGASGFALYYQNNPLPLRKLNTL